MKKFLLFIITASSFVLGCSKDNSDTNPTADTRGNFVGTWKGNISITKPPTPSPPPPNPIPGFPDFSDIPSTIPVTYTFSKNANINELLVEIKVDPTTPSIPVEISNPITATLNGNTYTYKEFDLKLQNVTVKCNGTGTISGDGKRITENGKWKLAPFPEYDWSSSLTKQP
jgi:hypothetical protein